MTRVSWGMIFPDAEKFNVKLPWVREYAASIGLDVPAAGLVNLPRHPSQLYEALFEGLVLWLVLWFILRPRRPFKGFHDRLLHPRATASSGSSSSTRGSPTSGIDWPIMLVPLENPVIQFSPFNFSTGQILCFLMIVAGARAACSPSGPGRAGRPRGRRSRRRRSRRGRKLRRKVK